MAIWDPFQGSDEATEEELTAGEGKISGLTQRMHQKPWHRRKVVAFSAVEALRHDNGLVIVAAPLKLWPYSGLRESRICLSERRPHTYAGPHTTTHRR